jgi:MoaA/NifB/PqqE/SkfB family radical SAM enzyme
MPAMSLPTQLPTTDRFVPSADFPVTESDAKLVVQSGDLKIAEHEDAAHEKRNWVRLTFDCNNHCVFCLDTLTHDGVMRDKDEVKKQILEGRKAGAARLILSGGEPTMHPQFIDFIKLGRLAGYKKIQTVTNGRKFMYPEFLNRCLEAGLHEITFSLHGPNAKIHDALVGVKGAFEQESGGLKAALADGRPIVNVDIVINKGNVKHLPKMLELYYSWGVREFDLLQVIPFGNAFREGRDILFYDMEEMRPYLLEAFAWSKKPDIHIWLNRFPPPHLEGYEHLIQDPYKLNDEVKGRKEEFGRFLDDGVDLDCREPARCKYCYLQRLCDTLYGIRDVVAEQGYESVRVDTEWESKQDKVFGGDPASAKRAKAQKINLQSDATQQSIRGGLLPIFSAAGPKTHPVVPDYPTTEELVGASGARHLWLKSAHVVRAIETLGKYPGITEIELELADYEGLDKVLGEGGALLGKTVKNAYAATIAQAEQLLALPFDFDVTVLLTKSTAPWLLALADVSSRLVVKQPFYERLTESAENDVDLRAFFGQFQRPVAVEGVPACVTGREPKHRPTTLDTAMMTPDGKLEIFRYAKRYIVEHYLTKSLRCKTCSHNATCDGMHVNYVRAHGYDLMQPVGHVAVEAKASSADVELPEPGLVA